MTAQRKILSMVLCIVMILGIVPVQVFADTTRHTVTFDMNYNGAGTVTMEVPSGEKVEAPTVKDRRGYELDGWFTADGVPFDFTRPVTGDLQLTAHWTYLGLHYLPVNIPASSAGSGNPDNDTSPDTDADITVTFFLNDGTGSAYRMQVVNAGETVAEPVAPAMSMYTFTGWYTEEATLHLYDFTSPVTESIELYAGWGNPNGDTEPDAGYIAGEGGGTIYSISDLTLEDNQVTAIVNADSASRLVIYYYEDNLTTDNINDTITSGLIATQNVMTPAYCELVPITLPVEAELPATFILYAELQDDKGEVLANYTSIDYTSLFAGFAAKTVNDFGDQTVIKFEDSDTENFGVLNADVIQITPGSQSNVLSYFAPVMEAGTEYPEYYVLENPDADAKALKVGDRVYFRGTPYMFKIGVLDSSEDGTAIRLVPGGESALAEFYDYLKVDMDLTMSSYGAANTPQTTADIVNESGTLSFPKFTPTIDWEISKLLSMKGELEIAGSIAVKIRYDLKIFGKDYWEFKFSPIFDITFSGDISFSKDNEDAVDKNEIELVDKGREDFDLLKIRIPTCITGLDIDFNPGLKIEYELRGGVGFTYTGHIETGFRYNSKDGRKNIDKKSNSISLRMEGSAELKIGPQLELGLEFLDEVIEAKIVVAAGAQAAGTAQLPVADIAAAEKHECHLCIDGTVYAFLSVNAVLEYEIIDDVLEGELANWSIIDRKLSFKPGPDFVFSVLNPQASCFGGKPTWKWVDNCPNCSYRVVVTCVDEDGNVVEDCNVKISGKASESGPSTYRTYLYDGSYTASAVIGGISASKSFKIDGSPRNITLTAIPVVEPDPTEDDKPGDNDDPDYNVPDQDMPGSGGSGETDNSLRDIVLLLDISGSMWGEKLTNTKATAIKFVKQILGSASDTRIAIVTYGSSARTVCDLTDDITALENAINGLSTDGVTNTYSGMSTAGSLLAGSNARKKAIVFMADGDANEGSYASAGDVTTAEGDSVYFSRYPRAVYELAKEYIEERGYTIYSFGFGISNNSSAFRLIKYTASFNTKGERNYWIVNNSSDINELTFVFEDIADTITTKKNIVVSIECPVDVTITLDTETLSRSNPETSFGKLVWKELGENDYSYVFTLDESKDYDIRIVGLTDGLMDFKIEYYTGDMAEFREFLNVPITGNTTISTSPTDRDADFCLFVDGDDGDTKPDIAAKADINETLNWEHGQTDEDTAGDGVPDEPGHTTQTFPTSEFLTDLAALYSQTFTIRATAGAGGRITHAGDNTLAFDTNKTFVIIPDAGFVIDTITVDGKAVPTAYGYTFKDIRKNHTIDVTFKAE